MSALISSLSLPRPIFFLSFKEQQDTDMQSADILRRTCGDGTRLDEVLGQCVPATSVNLRCGRGTEVNAEGTECIVDPTSAELEPVKTGSQSYDDLAKRFSAGCEALDRRFNDVLHKTGHAFCGPYTLFKDGRCNGTDPMTLCSSGTRYDEGHKMCVPDLDQICAPGVLKDASTSTCRMRPPSDFCSELTNYDVEQGKCVVTARACEKGLEFDPVLQMCKNKAVECGAGLVHDANTDSCLLSEDVCGKHTTLSINGKSRQCVPIRDEMCQKGTVWNDEMGACVSDPGICSRGTKFDEAEQKCIAVCTMGAHINEAGDACVSSLSNICGAGTTFDPTQAKCVSSS